MKKKYLTLAFSLLGAALLLSGCGMGNNAPADPQSQVAGARQEIVYGYPRELNMQARTITVDEVEMVGRDDTARRNRLSLTDADFSWEYYPHNERSDRRMLGLADDVIIDLTSTQQQNTENLGNSNTNGNNSDGNLYYNGTSGSNGGLMNDLGNMAGDVTDSVRDMANDVTGAVRDAVDNAGSGMNTGRNSAAGGTDTVGGSSIDARLGAENATDTVGGSNSVDAWMSNSNAGSMGNTGMNGNTGMKNSTGATLDSAQSAAQSMEAESHGYERLQAISGRKSTFLLEFTLVDGYVVRIREIAGNY